MYRKAISHIHTNHSFDCMVSPRRIVELAMKWHIDYLVITDHDTVLGSVEARNYAAEKGYKIDIPIAAEFTTDIGDVIASGVGPDFKRIKDHQALCRSAKDQGGFLILPHPYKGHRLDKINYDLIDCIEVYNSRCTIQENLQAYELAVKLGKKMVYGSDAHTLKDLGNAIFAYDGETPFNSHTVPVRMMPTPWHHNELSRFIRGIKLNKTKESLRAIKRSFSYAYKQLIGQLYYE